MATKEDVDRINEIRDEMIDLLAEAKDLARVSLSRHIFEGLKAYVFEQLSEHLEKANPYNQDMEDVAKAIEEEITEDDEDDEDENIEEERAARRGLYGPEYEGEKF